MDNRQVQVNYIHKEEGAPTQARSCLFSQPRTNPYHLSAFRFYYLFTSFHQNITQPLHALFTVLF
jgi:hypothetical protein